MQLLLNPSFTKQSDKDPIHSNMNMCYKKFFFSGPTQVLSNARQVSNYAAKKYTKLPITKPSECKGLI